MIGEGKGQQQPKSKHWISADSIISRPTLPLLSPDATTRSIDRVYVLGGDGSESEDPSGEEGYSSSSEDDEEDKKERKRVPKRSSEKKKTRVPEQVDFYKEVKGLNNIVLVTNQYVHSSTMILGERESQAWGLGRRNLDFPARKSNSKRLSKLLLTVL